MLYPLRYSPILGRTLEELIATQLYNYCDEHNILPPEQFGFRRHSSCEMALFAATDSWMKSVDKGSYAGALLVDLSKAFDMVSHQLLLSELRDIGCSTEVLNWLYNYFTDRLQRVTTYEKITDWIMVFLRALGSVHYYSTSSSETFHGNVHHLYSSSPRTPHLLLRIHYCQWSLIT